MIIDFFSFFLMQKYSTFGNSGLALLVAQKFHIAAFSINSFFNFFFFSLFALWLLNLTRKRYNREWPVKKLLVWDDYNICESWWQYLANTETKTVIQSSISCTRNILFRVTKIMFDINRIQSNFGGQTQRQIL